MSQRDLLAGGRASEAGSLSSTDTLRRTLERGEESGVNTGNGDTSHTSLSKKRKKKTKTILLFYCGDDFCSINQNSLAAN